MVDESTLIVSGESPGPTAGQRDDRGPSEHEGGGRRAIAAAAPMRFLAPLLLGLLGALVALWLHDRWSPPPQPLTPDEIAESVEESMASTTAPPVLSAEVYDAILPSFVLVQTEAAATPDADEPPGEDGPDSEAERAAEGEAAVGIGGGVIVDDTGSVLTAHHVVADASEIRITFADGTETAAEIAEADPESDIALLEPEDLPAVVVPAVLRGGNPRIGDEAFAVGNPLGLTRSISAGVISGVDRSIPTGVDGRTLAGLIQFDAAVNPGNSGGPLLDTNGHVIGVVTALANPDGSGSFSGIGFASPIPTGGGGGAIVVSQ